MEPRIQYTKTSDGVSIAYAVLGEGPPVVLVSGIFGAMHMASHAVRSRIPVEQLVALGWKVILYDMRGTGSSERDCDEFSLEAMQRDLRAVIDRAAPGERCALVGTLIAGPVAIAYTAQNPERVSSLVLRNAFASGAERDQALLGMMVSRVLRPIAEEHWEYFCLALAHALVGFKDSDEASKQAVAFQAAMSPQAYLAISEAFDTVDVTDLLESLQVPCLVVNDTTFLGVRSGWEPIARRLASRIPDARMVVTDDFPRALDEFLRELTEGDAKLRKGKPPSGMTAILFADIADSTALTERLGDAAFRKKARHLDGILRSVIRELGGTCIDAKTLGDGVLAVFTSARQAIEAALACGSAGDREGLPLHVGVHAGDVIHEDNNVYGGAVNVASRISGLSEPGEVLVSDIVRGLARTSAGVRFEDRGEQELKGVGEAVRVWRVVTGGSRPG